MPIVGKTVIVHISTLRACENTRHKHRLPPEVHRQAARHKSPPNIQNPNLNGGPGKERFRRKKA